MYKYGYTLLYIIYIHKYIHISIFKGKSMIMLMDAKWLPVPSKLSPCLPYIYACVLLVKTVNGIKVMEVEIDSECS